MFFRIQYLWFYYDAVQISADKMDSSSRSLCHSTKTSFPTFEALGNQTPHRCSRVLPGASAGHTAAAGTKGRRGGSLWIQAWLVSPRTRLCLPSHSFSISPIVRVKAELCGFCDVPSSWRVVSGKLPPNQQPFQSVRCGKLLTLSSMTAKYDILSMTTMDRGGEGRRGDGVCAGLIPSLLVMNTSKSCLQSYLLMERHCL